MLNVFHIWDNNNNKNKNNNNTDTADIPPCVLSFKVKIVAGLE